MYTGKYKKFINSLSTDDPFKMIEPPTTKLDIYNPVLSKSKDGDL